MGLDVFSGVLLIAPLPVASADSGMEFKQENDFAIASELPVLPLIIVCLFFNPLPPSPPEKNTKLVVYWNNSVCLSVRLFMCLILSGWYLLNLVWWCIIMRQKNLLTIFIVKVTRRADIIKTWLFLIKITSLLICWYICYQTWFDSTESEAKVTCEKNWVTAFKVKVTAKVQNVSECLSRLYFLTHWTFCYQTWYVHTALWVRVPCRKTTTGSLSKYLQFQGHREGLYNQNMIISTISSKLLFAAKLGLIA